MLFGAGTRIWCFIKKHRMDRKQQFEAHVAVFKPRNLLQRPSFGAPYQPALPTSSTRPHEC